MESATAEYIFNEATMRRGRYWHWFKKPILVWIFPVIGLFAVVLGFWLNSLNSQSITAWMLPIFGTYAIFRYWIIGFRFEHRIRANPMYGYELKWVVDDTGSTSIFPKGESKSSWEHLYAIYVTPDGFLIYPQKEIWAWIPKAAFKSEEEITFVEEVLMRQAVAKKL